MRLLDDEDLQTDIDLAKVLTWAALGFIVLVILTSAVFSILLGSD